MVPEEAANARPFGNPPSLIDHVYGGWPPLALKVVEYGTNAVACGSAVAVVIASPAFTLS
jgi:hypothetical protein